MAQNPQVMFRLPPELMRRLDDYASMMEANISQVLRDALRDYLDRAPIRTTNHHLTDDDVLAGLTKLIEHGPHVLPASEIIARIKEMVA